MLTPTLVVILAVEDTASGSPVAKKVHKIAGFVRIPQVQPLWCWAAVTAMVFLHYRKVVSRPCEWATLRLQRAACECCTTASSCETGHSILKALGDMAVLQGVPRPATYKEIIDEITAVGGQRPLVLARRSKAHVCVIYGLDVTDVAKPKVLIADPDGGFSSEDWYELVHNAVPGWWGTVFTKKGAASGPDSC